MGDESVGRGDEDADLDGEDADLDAMNGARDVENTGQDDPADDPHLESSNAAAGDLYRYAGALATIFTLGGIGLATLLDPTFSWTTDALSDLGVRDQASPVFNGGLITGGLIGIGYAVGLWQFGSTHHRTAEPSTDASTPVSSTDASTPVSSTDASTPVLVTRLRAAVFLLAMIAMAGVGIWDLTEPLHGPAAIGFYALTTAVFAIDGIDRHNTMVGRITLAFVPIHVVVWATYLAGVWPVTGLALPELPGALMLAAWVWLLSPLRVIDAAPISRRRYRAH